MAREDTSFQAIAENPDDDTPRLVHADWLEQRGDSLGVFIRVQCELAKIDRDDPRRSELEARNSDVLTDHNASLQRACRPPSDPDCPRKMAASGTTPAGGRGRAGSTRLARSSAQPEITTGGVRG